MFIVWVCLLGVVKRFMISDSEMVDMIVLLSFCIVCVVISIVCDCVRL